MGQIVPTFRPGDQVRIMQVTEMELAGVANLTGDVIEQFDDGTCSVCVQPVGYLKIPNNCLMRRGISPEQLKKVCKDAIGDSTPIVPKSRWA